MPKEMVYGKSWPYGEDSAAVAVAEVRWDRESEFVQLVTRCLDRSTHEVWKPEPMRSAAAIGGDALHAETNAGVVPALRPETNALGDPLTYHDGFYVDLTRKGINDLIRHLRRARDAAYGRDE